MFNAKGKSLELVKYLLLPSLINNADKTKELILIDDASPLQNETIRIVDYFRKALVTKFGRFRFVIHKENKGFAASYNEGLRLSRGSKVLVSNSDVYFPKGSVDSLAKYFHLDPRAGIVAPVSDSGYSQNVHIFARMKNFSPGEIMRAELFSRWLKKTMKGKFEVNSRLTGFCLCCRKDIFSNVGYFDERFRLAGAEDLDFIHRVRRHYLTILDLATFVEHGGPYGTSLSAASSLWRIFNLNIFNTGRYMWKTRRIPVQSFVEAVAQYLIGTKSAKEQILRTVKSETIARSQS